MAFALNIPLMPAAFVAIAAATTEFSEKPGATSMSGTMLRVVRHSSAAAKASLMMVDVTSDVSTV
jgi:hypothetical protein